ncbi:wall-associated receptor kinase-like 8 [Apium graveolens]|uniref:wall-associated receptor kinase-like 8 n=1 Tax=Apium graveolens TaxID=4045 RepID=UPI003D791C16
MTIEREKKIQSPILLFIHPRSSCIIHLELKNTIVYQMAVKLLMLLMLMFITGAFAQNTTNMSVALPGCQERCGSLAVPYPFGIGANCSPYRSMVISCNTSFSPPKAFLDSRIYYIENDTITNLEVLKISLEAGTIHINYPITTGCTDTPSTTDVVLNEALTFSNTENLFTSMGCDNLALLYTIDVNPIGVGGCISRCNPFLKKDNTCSGLNCCQTRFLPSLQSVRLSFTSSFSKKQCSGSPRYAFIVDQNWFENLKDIYSVQTMEAVPAVVNWRTTGVRDVAEPFPNSTLCGVNTFFTNQNLCACRKGYQGNPYLRDGCQDIDECALKSDRCKHFCSNTPGNYTCSCKDGWLLVDNYKCLKLEVDHTLKKASILVTATSAALGVILAATWWLYNFNRRRNIRKLKEKYFKRNGGLLLGQQVSSSQGNVETSKLFISNELEKATDHFSIDRIVGQGGQGTVYKGMLTDGKIVAVKRSKIEDESKLEHFINEVVILSQINHRNIVKLHGCCLETEVPLLVYEFIPNGTLMQYIHEDNDYFPLTWDVRLRVAAEVARALYYLHSAASIPIYHRDIKSTNILLDDKYRAKVADFGTSKSISIDQTHLTTRVQGTFGYLDPEYFQSSQFTDKSDVYSFGVVLAELLTGLKPILTTRLDDEARGLATLFLLAMEENRLLDIIDSRIVNEEKKEEMIVFANVAYRCLNLNGRKRPAMKQVVADLESIKNTDVQNYEDVEFGNNEVNAPWESDFTSSSISSTGYHTLSVDIQPLVMTN